VVNPIDIKNESVRQLSRFSTPHFVITPMDKVKVNVNVDSYSTSVWTHS